MMRSGKTDPREPGTHPPRLLGNRLLGALGRAELELLLPHLERVKLRARAVLFEPGEVIRHVHLPAEGTVISMLGVMEDGRTAELATIGCEGAVGGLVSAGWKPASSRGLVRVGGAAWRLDCRRLEAARAESPRLRDLLSRLSDSLLAQVMQSVACNALHTAEARACRRLLEIADRAGGAELSLTQEGLAEMLGLRRTTVTRVIADMVAKGAIRAGRGRIAILDRARLGACACECRDVVRGHFAAVAPGLYPSFPASEPLTIA
jgi:CRP-like cAMP-binding protein